MWRHCEVLGVPGQTGQTRRPGTTTPVSTGGCGQEQQEGLLHAGQSQKACRGQNLNRVRKHEKAQPFERPEEIPRQLKPGVERVLRAAGSLCAGSVPCARRESRGGGGQSPHRQVAQILVQSSGFFSIQLETIGGIGAEEELDSESWAHIISS